MLEDLIVAATNEALRKIDEISQASMSKVTEVLADLEFWFLMSYYSSQISRLIEELSKLPGIGSKVGPASGFSYHQYAEGPGKGTGVVDCGCQGKYSVL